MARGSRGADVGDDLKRLYDFLNQFEVRANARIDENKDDTKQRAYDQVFHEPLVLGLRTLVIFWFTRKPKTKDLSPEFLLGITRAVRFVVSPASRHWIASATPGLRFFVTAIKASGWKTAAVHCFFQDACDFLRKRSVLGGRAATKRFFEVVWNVCAYKNSFAISHLSVALSDCRV